MSLTAQPAVGATPEASPAAASSPGALPSLGPVAGPVATWQYRTELILWDGATATWYVTYSDDTRVDGIDAILNGNGAAGWELVAMFPEQTADAVVDGASAQESRRLRAVYKQPL